MSIPPSNGSDPLPSRSKQQSQIQFRIAAGIFLLIAWTLCGLFAVSIAGHEPEEYDMCQRHLSPARAHPWGTVDLGHAVFGRVLYGTRFTLGIGYAVTIVTLSVGTVLGSIPCYSRRLDRLITR